jgi:hypothetical protein
MASPKKSNQSRADVPNLQHQQTDGNTTSDSESHSSLQLARARAVSLAKVKPTVLTLKPASFSLHKARTSQAPDQPRLTQVALLRFLRHDKQSSTYEMPRSDPDSYQSEESHESCYITIPEEAPSLPKCCYLRSRVHSLVMYYDYREISHSSGRLGFQLPNDNNSEYLKISS